MPAKTIYIIIANLSDFLHYDKKHLFLYKI